MGDADQIYNTPGTPYTQKLIDAVPEGKLEDIKKSEITENEINDLDDSKKESKTDKKNN